MVILWLCYGYPMVRVADGIVKPCIRYRWDSWYDCIDSSAKVQKIIELCKFFMTCK